MKINDIKLKDIKKGSIYNYTNDENTEIKEFKLKQNFIPENSGYYLITGKTKIADGTVYPSILGISSNDSGELFEVYLFLKDRLVKQDNKLHMKLGKKKYQIFPYKYHLNVKVDGDKNRINQF